jgi:hypothetical protein
LADLGRRVCRETELATLLAESDPVEAAQHAAAAVEAATAVLDRLRPARFVRRVRGRVEIETPR